MNLPESNRQKTKGQHYIPQFYLKRFSEEKKGEFYIWCFNLKSSKIFKSNISKVCKENWFYDKHNVFENGMSVIESQHSKIYKFIRDNPFNILTEPEKRTIMEFVYFTHARTRKAREGTLYVNKDVQNNEEFRNKFQKEFPGKNIEKELEGIKQSIQLANIFGIEIPEYNHNPKTEETMERLMSFKKNSLVKT